MKTMAKFVKWYVNVGKWKPTREEWLGLTSSVAEEEVSYINKFVFQEESKSSLIGRALERKFVSQATSRPSNELKLIRTELRRPVVCKKYQERQLGHLWPQVLDFNVSHSGDYCVLAGVYGSAECPQMSVGVDVTKIVKKDTRAELDKFLERMSRREFSKSEWQIVERALDDRQKCINFTRLWCLKESFIKSIGLGLQFKLQRLDFRPHSTTIEELKNSVVNDTKVLVDGEIARDWRFLETALDDEHLVAVGYNIKGDADYKLDESFFVEIPLDSLLGALTPISEPKEENWTHFSTRLTKST